MKKIIFIIIAILVAGSLLIINKGNLMSKENLMDNTYTVLAPDGTELKFDKATNLLVPNNNEYKKVRTSKEYLEIQSKYLLDSRSILDSSPYKNYKPLYYNPKPNSLGQTDYLSFKPWLDISYKPISTKLSPWTKSEKAYYESLKDKRDRYIYLVKRSNLKCTMIDIPDDAIGRVDSNGKLTKPEYAEIYDEVDRNKNTLKSELFIGEWNLCAGVLGNPSAFGTGGSAGFKARDFQKAFLAAQLGVVEALNYLADSFKYYTYGMGVNKNLDTYEKIRKLYKNPPLDEYGMIPYLDEIVGNYFVMDFNRGGVILDPIADTVHHLREMVEDKGKLLDPRDIDANETTREEFLKYAKETLHDFQAPYDVAEPDDTELKQVMLNRDSGILEAKIMSLTPPEGYPNAPYYNTPEELTRLYEAGKLDKKLNPLTPVMYRDSFPEDLRQKILSYAKEHNIKD
ncbi:MAG: thioredoxin reductase [Campylobacter concisus]|uniref:thioredoxin reductase n=1 Tax=Campylobacter concisus TaxID=199 RepID=UPI000CD965CE|nr:thioredoxin reductase [Campylobacter concisus]MBS6287773.1 thioredoxin reductase [Campylobacter concisus]MCA6130033.1 thioredoxin reductase [Campylobacter concisus]